MKHWINRNYRTLIITAFVIPIITVALVSITHVTKWYGISNPISWALYLSIGIEIAALSALAAISAKMGKKVYFPFAIVTLIQFIGNIYFAYSYVDTNGDPFKNWVELVSPLLQYLGVEPEDYIGHKRFLALFAGGMLPIISLSFLHMLVKFTEEDRIKDQKDDALEEKFEKYKKEHSGDTTNTQINQIDSKDLVGEIARVRLEPEDLEKLEKILLKSDTSISTPKTDRADILADTMKKYQDLGLYNAPNNNPLIKDNEITPALSDEDITKMNMDEWEKKYEYVDDEDNELLDENLNNYIYDIDNEPIIEEENTIEPTIEEVEENIKTLSENQNDDNFEKEEEKKN